METTIKIYTIHGGFWMMVCYNDGFPGPCGVIWGYCSVSGNKKSSFRVFDSYIPSFTRRKGIRTAINDYLFDVQKVDVITSPSGSKEGGKAFMESSGYVVDRRTGEYILTKAKHKKVQKAKKKKEEEKPKGD